MPASARQNAAFLRESSANSQLPNGPTESSAPRVYLKTPNAPGQRTFSRCAAPFFLEIRQYSCEKMSCSAQKFLAAGHIGSFQIHPRGGRLCPLAKYCVFAEICGEFATFSGRQSRRPLQDALKNASLFPELVLTMCEYGNTCKQKGACQNE